MWKWLHRGLVTTLMLVALISITSWLQIWNPEMLFSRKSGLSTDTSIGLPEFLKNVGIDGLIFFKDKSVQYWTILNEVDKLADDSFDIDLFGITVRHDVINVSAGIGLQAYINFSIEMSFLTPAVLSAIYPAVFFIRSYRRYRKRSQALQPCGQCGYDLQGNESGTCPECGKPVKVAP